MRVLVCGGRWWGRAPSVPPRVVNRMDEVERLQFMQRCRVAAEERAQTFVVLDEIHRASPIALVIHGDAKGADRLAERWATKRMVDVERYPADWRAHGRAAGPIRNRQMLDEAQPDLVVAFPGGHGTASMIGMAHDANVEVFNVTFEAQS